MDIKKLVEEIKGLTLSEVSDLVKALEKEFGVSAAAPVAVAAAAPAAGAAKAAEEKTEFDVVLKAANPDRKAESIKAVKEITGLGLLDAKGLVDKAPATILEKVSKDAAADAKAKLEAAGATVEVK